MIVWAMHLDFYRIVLLFLNFMFKYRWATMVIYPTYIRYVPFDEVLSLILIKFISKKKKTVSNYE